MSMLKPTTWQKAAIGGLVRRLSERNASRAALLQLPTGFGKSLVAIEIYKALRRKRPGLKLVVVLPTEQDIPAGWRQALGLIGPVPLFEPLRLPSAPGTITFTTRLRLKRAMIEPGRGRPTRLAREITRSPHLVIIDEVHRHRGVFAQLSQVFQAADADTKRIAEARLSSPFRPPSRGRRAWPKWLLLSATPINPVSLDRIDRLDERSGNDTNDPETEEHGDEEILANAVEAMHGALAQLAGHSRGHWFDDHVEAVRSRLQNATATREELPSQLVIYPPTVRTRELRPNARRRWDCRKAVVSKKNVEAAIHQLVLTAEALDKASGAGLGRRATAERLILSGGLMTTQGNAIQGQQYSRPLARSVHSAVRQLRRAKMRIPPAKLQALRDFVKQAHGEHVLVFCVHRAVAESVSSQLSRMLGKTAVRTAIGEVAEDTRDWFNEDTRGETRVLIATDACSESIDLHERANILAHYELPWSPLRVLQRVGRLWRLRTKAPPGQQPKRPRLPAVVHFAHPGSIDEEILERLYRRWGYLRALGLDSLDYEQAMGMRLPAVPWKTPAVIGK